MDKASFLSKKVSLKRVLIAVGIVLLIVYISFVMILRLEWRIRNTIEYFKPLTTIYPSNNMKYT